jgi:uncharacterized protein YeaO (DUF488 family)
MTVVNDQALSRETLEKHLRPLVEKSHQGVVLFAARCALRVFPLLAYDGNFDYWNKAQQASYILSIWRAILAAYISDTKTAAAAVYTVVAARDSVSNSYAAASVSDAAAAAARAADVDAANYAAHYDGDEAAAYAHTSAHAASAHTSADAASALAGVTASKIAAVSDLSHLENDDWQKLFSTRLWPRGIKLADSYHHLLGALNKLIGQTTDLTTKYELTRVAFLHSQLIDGEVELTEVEETVSRLNEYFEKNPSVLKKQNSLQDSTRAEEGQARGPSNINSTDNRQSSDIYSASTSHNNHQAATADALNREQLAAAVAALLIDPKNSHHQTIGLLGDWGSGKSSMIKLLQQQLFKQNKQQPFLFSEFNAWEYEHTDNLQAGIAQEMIKTLSSPAPTLASIMSEDVHLSLVSYCKWSFQRLRLTLKFAEAIHGKWRLKLLLLLLITSYMLFYFGTFPEHEWAGVGVGVGFAALSVYFFKEIRRLAVSPLAKELLTYLRLPNYAKHLGTIPVMRKNIKAMCEVRLNENKNKKRLLYIVDDLDRCDHKNIVKVLEAVRLVLEIPQVIVIIAIDQRIALSALALHYKDLANYHPAKSPTTIARDYLSKIIHLPITLSEPDKDSIAIYLKHLWKEEGDDDNSSNGEINSKAAFVVAGDNNNDSHIDNNSMISADDSVPKNPLTDIETLNTLTDVETLVTNAGETEQKKETSEIMQTREKRGLSPEQKVAFTYWINYFHLANPRQLKRLDNSYKLLRHFYGADQAAVPSSDNVHDPHIFPVMMTLFTLEYVNQLEDVEKRLQLKTYLTMSPKPDDSGNDIITLAIAEITRKKLEGRSTSLICAVEPFVLPAIDVEMQDKEV